MKNNLRYSSAIILPLKENFSNINFGAVSVWVSEYLKFSNNRSDLIFCRKLGSKIKYLRKEVFPINIKSKYYTNLNYIKNINNELLKRNIKNVEIHNRPEYALYLLDNNPNIKINLIFHNDPNKLRNSNLNKYKLRFLNNCNKVIFVSRWLKKKFFENLNIKHKNNVDIIYNFINPIRKFPKKRKLIVFSGKLNKSKGYDIFSNAIIKVLNEFKDWSAVVYGDEPRQRIQIKHKRLKINKWVKHKSLLKVYEKSSISIVNPTWEEPFGRTALESASRGCAVITSLSGGLSETFKNNLVLKNNNTNNLYLSIKKLILNNSLLKKIQKENFNNILHTPEKSVKKLDQLRKQKILRLPLENKSFKILHISNFGLKNDHRLFNLSIAKKISNGLIRNGHDVIDFDYRNFHAKLFERVNIDFKILSVVDNYRPDLIIFGHNNVLQRETLDKLKSKYSCKLIIWYEDHVMKGDPNYEKNLKLLEKNSDLIDQYFITTSPDIIKSTIPKHKLNYLPIPVDPNIEQYDFSEITKQNDLFFALSHGVNYGKLKNNVFDDRSIFINDLINKSKNNISFNILGLYNEEPKWNYNFNKELMFSKTALNLSRGGPSKYCSSNRIASLMGNGMLPFIHEKVRYQDFFDNDEIITYKNSSDLIKKLLLIKEKNNLLVKRSKNAKKSYFQYFENTIVSDSIIYKVFNTKKKYQYIWDKKNPLK